MKKKNKKMNEPEIYIDDSEIFEPLDLTEEECDLIIEEELRKMMGGSELEKEEIQEE